MPGERPRPNLTTTSYALLGLLRRGPLSAYELTTYMKRSALAHLWPRTEAGIYREPKHLVAHGYAEASEARTGNRRRTVYRITPAGRRALRAWLAVPGRPTQFEAEGAVKVILGDGSDLETLRANLAALAEHPVMSADDRDGMIDDWLDGRLRYPEQLHFTAMAADLIDRLHRVTADWARDWLALTASWTGTDLDDVSEPQARAALLGQRRRR